MSVYPKASAPITAEVLRAANARADRWRARWEAVRADLDAATAELKALRESA